MWGWRRSSIRPGRSDAAPSKGADVLAGFAGFELRLVALVKSYNCVEAIGKPRFHLDDVYAFEAELSRLYPDDRHVRNKIRQQLQVLRDRGYLDFVSRGCYRLRPPG